VDFLDPLSGVAVPLTDVRGILPSVDGPRASTLV